MPNSHGPLTANHSSSQANRVASLLNLPGSSVPCSVDRDLSMLERLLEQALSSHVAGLKSELQRELRNMHVDMLRQFQALQARGLGRRRGYWSLRACLSPCRRSLIRPPGPRSCGA